MSFLENTPYDFNSFSIKKVNLGFDTQRSFVQITYTDPLLKGYSVTVIEDSISPNSSVEEKTLVAENVKWSQNSENKRLVTMVGCFPRVVLSEFNTHRVFSRNSASSRARSIRTTLHEVLENPYIPLFTVNQRGMSGGFISGKNKRLEAEKQWLDARNNAVLSVMSLLSVDCLEQAFEQTCERRGLKVGDKISMSNTSVLTDFLKHSNIIEILSEIKTGSTLPKKFFAEKNFILQLVNCFCDLYYDNVYNGSVDEENRVEKLEDRNSFENTLNVHKQTVNRLLEPFMFHEVVFSSTMFKNFLKLRTDIKTAQPEIYVFARLMEKALKVSQPVGRNLHLPFVSLEERSFVVSTNSELNTETVLERSYACWNSSVRELCLQSASRCAQISYKTTLSENSGLKKTSQLGQRLLDSGHMSPFEHIGFTDYKGFLPAQTWDFFECEFGEDFECSLGGNLGSEWVQLRKILELGD